MKYETPEMKVLLLKAQDVVTVPDNGEAGDGTGTESGEDTVPGAGSGNWD